MAERAALYACVSSSRQEREQTVVSQVEAPHKAAAELGLQVPPQHCYVDEGFSGTRLDRPAFDAMRDAAADGLLDVVLVFAPDRLARNHVHQQVVLEELAARGVRVHFVEQPIGEKAEDTLLVQMQGVIAEYERSKIIERTRRGRMHKVRTGQTPPFSRPPYGYRLVTSPDGRQKTVVLHEGLDALDFEGRQRLVRLLIERVVVTGEHVTIEHAVPLSGRFCRLRENDVGRLRLLAR